MINEANFLFPDRFLKCTDMAKHEEFIDLIYGLMQGDEETNLDDLEELLAGRFGTFVKDGVIVGSFHMLEPEEVETMDDAVLYMSIVTEDGEVRPADELDVQLLLGVSSFTSMLLDDGES